MADLGHIKRGRAQGKYEPVRPDRDDAASKSSRDRNVSSGSSSSSPKISSGSSSTSASDEADWQKDERETHEAVAKSVFGDDAAHLQDEDVDVPMSRSSLEVGEPGQPDSTVRFSALDDVEFPSTKDEQACIQAVTAAYMYIEENGSATMRELVADVLPKHPVGYDVVVLEEGERYRGAWWRRVVKPGLEAIEDIEKPPTGGSKWRYSP